MTQEILTQLNGIDLTERIKAIKETQDNFFLLNDEYVTTQWSGINSVNEKVISYITPKKEKGYGIIFKQTINNIEYIKLIGFGVEASERTRDWIELN